MQVTALIVMMLGIVLPLPYGGNKLSGTWRFPPLFYIVGFAIIIG